MLFCGLLWATGLPARAGNLVVAGLIAAVPWAVAAAACPTA